MANRGHYNTTSHYEWFGYIEPARGTLNFLQMWHDATAVCMPDYPFGTHVVYGVKYDIRRISEITASAEFKKAVKRLNSADREILEGVYTFPHEERSRMGSFIVHEDSDALPEDVRRVLARCMDIALKRVIEKTA